jgi:hypothetical protein
MMHESKLLAGLSAAIKNDPGVLLGDFVAPTTHEVSKMEFVR